MFVPSQPHFELTKTNAYMVSAVQAEACMWLTAAHLQVRTVASLMLLPTIQNSPMTLITHRIAV